MYGDDGLVLWFLDVELGDGFVFDVVVLVIFDFDDVYDVVIE